MVQDIEKLAWAFAGHTGLKLSTIANYAVNDGKLFKRFAEGRSCTLKTATRMVDWLNQRWPADLEWPADIPRPPHETNAEDAA